MQKAYINTPRIRISDRLYDILKNVFNASEACAVCLKKDNKTIGAFELKLNGHTDMTEKDEECEFGC